MIPIDLARPNDTYTALPSGDSTVPIGRGGIGVPSVGGILIDSQQRVLLRVDDADGAAILGGDEGRSCESGVKTIERGRAGVLIRPTTFSEAVSIATTSFSPSQLT